MVNGARAQNRGEASADSRPQVFSPLGSRLREERNRRGLSLRELARRLKVSPSLVSQIETGKINPSVQTLYAIVNELGVSLDDVFRASKSAASKAQAQPRAERNAGFVQRADDRSVQELESGVRWERLTTQSDAEVDFLYATYEAGGASSRDGKLVRHDGREFGIVLTGRLGVTVGFDEHVLEPGDSISFQSAVPHRLHNDGHESVTAVWVVVSGRYHDDSEGSRISAKPRCAV